MSGTAMPGQMLEVVPDSSFGHAVERHGLFGDLYRYLRRFNTPDQRIEDEARIVAQAGAWIGKHVFGPVAAAMAAQRPTTVKVMVLDDEPTEARSLLFRPLELAHTGRRPLSLRDVTLVMQHGGDSRAEVAP